MNNHPRNHSALSELMSVESSNTLGATASSIPFIMMDEKKTKDAAEEERRTVSTVSSSSSSSSLADADATTEQQNEQEGEQRIDTEDVEFLRIRSSNFPQRLVEPGSFNPPEHFQPRVLNATIHPTVREFQSMTNEQRIRQYCHVNADVNFEALFDLIENYKAKHMMWCGVDLMHVSEKETGRKFMMVIETNTCASGSELFPLVDENIKEGGYRKILERSFWPEVQRRTQLGLLPPNGKLGVIYDKDIVQASGYAAALAEIANEDVIMLPLWNEHQWGRPNAEWNDDVLYVRDTQQPLRAAFRYVTYKPWTKIPASLPVNNKVATFVCNPISACLAGGRNKMVAAKAYETLNKELDMLGLTKIRTPRTIKDVPFGQVRKWIERIGGYGCIKAPYTNSGQGVYTITNAHELDRFEEIEKDNLYSLFIVQSLIANSKWSSSECSSGNGSTIFHNGTVPNKKGQIYVADLRLQVSAHPTEGGFEPVSMYARRAAKPLEDTITLQSDSWSQLGTNLSVNLGNGLWGDEWERLLLMDRKDFDQLGLSLDCLIDAYVQSCLCHIAIDKQAEWLHHGGDEFNLTFFRSVCDDDHLLGEIEKGNEINQK